ncbi:glycosyltransferase family 39 protein [Haloferax sp. AB510]|uniref:glycosyltransferase family 39 protein n=1 Tax=Haloferax sp. AB510 TaxID=2934172 RepID=UPI00209BDA4D|nr:glycosyltransferase family 39 protein [Haloferax sp. AB510]MCO8265025.1 glycosyltransferase family 39 protein [Haloferax sp. AB510]
MTMLSSVYDRLQRAELDVLAAALGVVLALALFPLRFLSSQIFIVTLPILLGVGSLLYLAAARGRGTTNGLPTLAPSLVRLISAGVFFGLAVMVVLAVVQGERSILFMDIGGVVGTLLLGQILLAPDDELRPSVFLAEILVYSFVVRFAALYTAPGYIGIDIWSHTTFVQMILQADSLSAINDIKYYASPLFHLLTAASTHLLDLSLRNALYLSIGVVMPLVPILVYGTARLLVPLRWALTAGALYAMGDQVVRWGIHLIPTSLGLLFFLACLYCLVRITHASERWRDFGLLVLFSTAVILTHQVSSFIMLVLLFAGFIAQVLLRFDFFTEDPDPLSFSGGASSPVNLAGLVGFNLGLIVFTWSLTPYQGDTFLETVINYLVLNLFNAGFLQGVSGSGGSAGASGVAGSAGQTFFSQLSTYVTEAGFLMLIFAGLIGCLTVLNRSRATQTTYTFVGAIVAMLFVVLGLPLVGIESFVPGRWFAYLYALLAIIGVLGFRHLANRTSLKVVGVILLLFVLVYPNVMLMSNDGAMDSPAFPDQHERLSYTEQELAAIDTYGSARSSQQGGELYTDLPYGTVWERTNAYPAEPLPAEEGRPVPQGITAYREYQSQSASYFPNEQDVATNLDPSKTEVCPPTTNYVYANGEVTICSLPGAN